MSLSEALRLRDVNIRRARHWARVAADERLRWGVRYEAAVTGDDCLDLAKDFASYVSQLQKATR